MDNKEHIKALLIFAQNDILRMTENAKTQKQAELLINNNLDAKFHSGNIHAFEYACKHLTNILEKLEALYQPKEVDEIECFRNFIRTNHLSAKWHDYLKQNNIKEVELNKKVDLEELRKEWNKKTFYLRDVKSVDTVVIFDWFIEKLSHLQKPVDSDVNLLNECKLQLEYLNDKFGETGTTNALLAKFKQLNK